MKTIDNNEARKLELNILVQFADYCKKKNLRYYLAYGTLIGAVRHRGFIPWDNDVDVVMPRPDYEELIRLSAEEKIADYVKALDYKKERTFPFLKLVDERTRLKEHYLVTEENLGVYIDIFPLDGMPDDPKKRKKLFKKAARLYKLFAIANYRKNTGANAYKKFLKMICYPFSRMISSSWVCDRLNRLCEAYDYDNSEYVADIVWGYEANREIMPRHYFETIEMEFEGHTFCVPADYDKMLKQTYGNYMQLPPEEDRIVHDFEAEWK